MNSFNENEYADYGVTCEDCNEFESLTTVSHSGLCHAGRDVFYQETGVSCSSVIVKMTSDAGKCSYFDPTDRCLDRIDEERDNLGMYGVKAGVDFPSTI